VNPQGRETGGAEGEVRTLGGNTNKSTRTEGKDRGRGGGNHGLGGSRRRNKTKHDGGRQRGHPSKLKTLAKGEAHPKKKSFLQEEGKNKRGNGGNRGREHISEGKIRRESQGAGGLLA